MKKVKFEDIKKLESISNKIDRIPKEKINSIIEDMKWLIKKLSEYFVRIKGE